MIDFMEIMNQSTLERVAETRLRALARGMTRE
jgi:hypothetical protein